MKHYKGKSFPWPVPCPYTNNTKESVKLKYYPLPPPLLTPIGKCCLYTVSECVR